MEIGDRQQTFTVRSQAAEAVTRVAGVIKAGGLVVLPTDTVYGVGCSAFNAMAVEQLYAVKQRPLSKPIPVLLADETDLSLVARAVPALALPYIQRYWPGPLTLILHKQPALPAALSPDETIAVRIPDHPLTRAVIRAAGTPMAMTSANLAGQPPAITGEQARATLAGLVTAVLDDGPSPLGEPSTVLDCTGKHPVVLRAGSLDPR